MLFAHARLTLVASSATLLTLLFGSTGLPAQNYNVPSGLGQCTDPYRQLAEMQDTITADIAAENRVREKLDNLHMTLKGYAARLQTNPDQSQQILQAMIAVLSQIKQAHGDLKPLMARLVEDRAQQQVLESALSDCYDRMYQEGKNPDSRNPDTVLVLNVLDRNETVSLAYNKDGHGDWRLTSRSRQGITLPSHDPAASDTTTAVKVDRTATATVQVTPPLPGGWHLTLGIGADGSTSAGAQNVCTSNSGCQASSGPYPGVRRGLGKGWAASEAVEVWICRSEVLSCVGQGDPVATVNINWAQ